MGETTALRGPRRRRVAALMAVTLTAGLLIGLGSPARAATIVVSPGQSIQAAIDAAPPGSTIRVEAGTYHENLLITKDNITLRGAGSSSTFLLPPAHLTPTCFGPDFGAGICVQGDVDFQTGNVITPVSGTTIRGFSISGFPGNGILLVGTAGSRIERNRLDDDGVYGLFDLLSTGTQVLRNSATGNDEAGIYIGDSPTAHAVVSGNTATHNGYGIFIRDASLGEVTHNTLSDNCVGIFFLNTGSGTDRWSATGNNAHDNRAACPAEDGPPLSGIGIGVAGATNMLIQDNTTLDNLPGGPTAVSGGIAVFSTASFGGSDEAHVSVISNQSQGNDPDLFWDGNGTDIVFTGNSCTSSVPPGLC